MIMTNGYGYAMSWDLLVLRDPLMLVTSSSSKNVDVTLR